MNMRFMRAWRALPGESKFFIPAMEAGFHLACIAFRRTLLSQLRNWMTAPGRV
jgi:hypothetical protein